MFSNNRTVIAYRVQDTTEYALHSEGGGGGELLKCLLQGEENLFTLQYVSRNLDHF